MRGVTSRDSFQREMGQHFSIDPDHSNLWFSLHNAVSKAVPCRLRFEGWTGFEELMPRYDKRLKHLLVHHQKVWGKYWFAPLYWLGLEFE
jgi:hypothetical protein